MNLTPEHIGMLKGAAVTAAFFSAGIAVGLVFLHRKHEEALDKLESDTAKLCLDMAAEHYEGVIRRREKAAEKASAERAAENLDIDSDELQKEIAAMNNHEEPDEDWTAMREEMDRHIDEYEALAQQVAHKDAECTECLKKLGFKIYAENDLIIKAHPGGMQKRLTYKRFPDIEHGPQKNLQVTEAP